jgi:regulator of replication initiation timing
MKNKILFFVVAAINFQAFSVVTSSSIAAYMSGQYSCGFPGVETLFDVLSQVQDQIKESTTSFKDLNSQLGGILEYYETIKSERESLFACIKAKFNTFTLALADCQESSATSAAYIKADTAIATAALENLRSQTEEQISSLREAVSQLRKNIQAILSDYATITNMSEENVNAAIATLNAIRTEYETMVAERTTFVTELDKVLEGVTSYESAESSDLRNLKTEYCA